MRKRYQKIHSPIQKKDESPTSPNEIFRDDRPLRKKRSKAKPILFTILALLIIVVGYIGYSMLSSANNILASNISVGSLIKQSSLKQAEGVTNVLILGKGGDNHAGGQLTDSLILARIQEKDKKVALISIPRDLMVSVPGRGNVKINEAYTEGYLKEKEQSKRNDSGAKMSSQVVEKHLGVPVHYYMVVDFIGFKDLIDAMGGVSVNVEKALDDPYYPKDSIVNGKLIESEAYAPVHIKAGVQTMNGEVALKYARSRETTSDFDRAKRQQALIFAIKEKAMSLGILSNPVRMNEIFQSLGNHIKTSFNANELGDLFNVVKEFDRSKVINKVIDNSQDGLLVSSDAGFYHLEPKAGSFTDIQKFVKNIFNETEQIPVAVEVYNGTKTTGLAGKLADKLKQNGIVVTTIENSATLYDKTTIMDGTNSSASYSKIKNLVGQVQRQSIEEKGKIKIYIGKDYAD